MTTGILPHKYINASDDIAAYEADKCNRQAVTAKFAYDCLCDIVLYVYRENNCGLDPWLVIDGGMDMSTEAEEYFLCYGRAGEMKVPPDFRVFVSKRALEGLGLL